MPSPIPCRTSQDQLADVPVTPTTARGTRAQPGARFRHSVCKWCYPAIPLAELARVAKRLGLASIELLEPMEFPVLRRHGLVCAMVSFPTGTTPHGVNVGGIANAWNRPEHHDTLVELYRRRIAATAQAGYENLICFSGHRDGLDDEQGLEHCATGLKRILAAAERSKVTLCMELLNSKVDHPGYMCDHTAWGVALAKRLGSAHFKLLYDIYHMQIMEGDVIRTIRDNHPFIAHYHTGGNPGRHEIDATQELNYPAVARAIAATGFGGFVAQEFVPTRDPLTSLRQAVELCTV